MRGLVDKVAVVSGASSGIGRAVALRLAQEGARLVLADIREAPLPEGYDSQSDKSTTQIIQESGKQAVFVPCNTADRTQVSRLLDTARQTYGSVDIVCNIAGIGYSYRRLGEKDEADIRRLMEINFFGVLYACSEAIRIMREQDSGGKIINMSSVCASRGAEGQPDYCAAKGAVSALTRQLAVDYGRYGININCVAPGWISTAMQRFKSGVKREAAYNIDTPLKRCGRPEDIAAAVAFLASDDASYINGHELVVDGGNTIVWDSYCRLEADYYAEPD